MAISKEKKVEIYKSLVEKLKDARSVVFVNFHGLGVNQTTELRRKLKAEGADYFVAKKTLVKRAFDEIGPEGEMPKLDGELALSFSDDLTAPARGVYDFQKTHKDNVVILGGVFEGKFMDQTAMMEIATIPPTKILYGQFVNLINTPIQQFATVLDRIAEKKG